MDWFFQAGCEFYMKKKKTDWLSTLLHSKFFGSCIHHQELRKNEENVFCIDCSLGFCRHCMTAHCFHRRLQICKYVYHDVVRLQEMQKHLDCSKIQTYKINGEKAVHLNPRPQSKDTKPSTKSKLGGTCEACGRYLQDLPNRFCSIACKVSVISVKPKDQSHNLIAVPIPEIDMPSKENCYQETDMVEESSISIADSSEEIRAWLNSALKPRKLLHKRKGVPRRAPLC
ncbi:protein RGF1 INDUCIBLE TRANSCRIPTION FACTOR 1 [Alnus glutinosa]|uniref:protein RGF1 INDUCIBLE TRANSCRIPTION FACTOR 1 n=1 Tax=Alnus glutinosa TaxID=3517 RepID=UPI002D76A314|nr:protein RGF1 INDUCIBLE TRANSCRIPTION FACTOR 1 [Alnus glutinosa]XP_062150167.1 protein RGF1 INDUCIBLE TRANSCRIPTION FACTOR 1 [Alnus glutinosa]